MNVISWNVNGIRACVKKGFFDFLSEINPDILCLQESKAHIADIEDHILNPKGYQTVWHSAEKKGYSGTAILSKPKPSNVLKGFGIDKFDSEGRVTMAEYDHFIVFSVYFPNGQMNDDRLMYKLEFYREFFNFCNDLRAQGKELIITGDYNTAHQEIDLARPKENETTSGFLPIEREWMDLIVEQGYVDTFRHLNPEPDNYSWWSYRTRARERNIGWRIDYVFVTPGLLPAVSDAYILADITGSDHCPVGITLDLSKLNA
ncbi:MAG: exodeoxyribonuclease III [bacterium]|nr:exodeoxyribonuclease III [bacterium]